MPVTFVDLPFLPEQRPDDDGTMTLEAQRTAVLAVLDAVAAQLCDRDATAPRVQGAWS